MTDLMSGDDFAGFSRGRNAGGLTAGCDGKSGDSARVIGGTVWTSAECAVLNSFVM